MDEKDYEKAQSMLPKELRYRNEVGRYIPTSDEELSKDGTVILCKACGSPKKRIKEFPSGRRIWVSAPDCRCAQDYADRIRFEERNKVVRRIYDCRDLRESIGAVYVDKKFEDLPNLDRPDYLRAVTACKKYCENIESVLSKGQGLYLFSPKAGNGKTTLMACVRNALLSKNVPCVLINVTELMRYAGNRGKQTSYADLFNFNMFQRVDVLILDDIGAIDLTSMNGYATWVQNELYDLLEIRNRNNKCTCFTSNYSPDGLRKERGYDFKTVDRILERSSMILRIDGDSFRG